MKVDVFFTPGEVEGARIPGSTVVVIDVVRATTTIVEALANGAWGIYPTSSTEDAVKLAGSLGREDTLLCGERKGLKIEGFDLGNSPADFRRDVVEGKRLVMSTTNGTVAIVRAQDAERLVVAAFTNLSAAARLVADSESLVVICAGSDGRFSLEDALCAGHLLTCLPGVGGEGWTFNDGARAVLDLASARSVDVPLLRKTLAGGVLAAIGADDDLEACAVVDAHDLVPVLSDRALRLVQEA
ncbi:MAG: 2-phosphosulfolactate phosphatase [Gemmatimonadota bacterium]|nr:2-phosphosulfolactate phosphatase [Gemmatimonadota bacterium]MDH5759383.1 2-phosphosulfolactate phosphatase [Gemmatimonadota bacterium]